MSRVLKSRFVTVDADHSVTIDVTEADETLWEQEAEQSGQSSYGSQPEEAEAGRNSPAALLYRAGREAEQIIRIARQEANDILRKANETAEEMIEANKREGFDTGMRDGYESGRAEAEALVLEARQTLDDAARQREQIIDSVEGELLELIIKIAGKLLSDTIRLDPQVIMVLIRQGLSATTSTGDVVVRVCAEDYDTVIENKDEISKWTEASSRLEIVKDLSLAQCDCVIETPYGNIDCSLDRQYKTLTENLYRVYGQGEPRLHLSG